MPTHISLPNERVEQLRMIARVKGQTIPALIADFVRSEIENGTIPDAIPGIDVAQVNTEIVVKSNTGFAAAVPLDQGPILADLLRESGNLSASDPDRKERWLQGLAALSGIQVKRAGNGVKIISPITGEAYPLNLDIAVDLANQIEKAVE